MKKAGFQSLLAPIVAEYRKRPYEYWLARVHKPVGNASQSWLQCVEGDSINFEVSVGDGTVCQVEIEAFWDGDTGGDIRVLFAIDDGGWSAYYPVTESFIIAPDGRFVGE